MDVSRNEAILTSIIEGTEYTDPPQSRNEELLLEIKKVIESGGGGSSSNDSYTKSETDSLLEEKVDKEPGKQLSEENFTAEDKEKLDEISETTIPEMQEKISKTELKSTIIKNTTTNSGNLKLNNLNSNNTAVVCVPLKENYIAHPYTDQHDSWYIHVVNPFTGEKIALTEITVTVYYYEIVSEQNNETASYAEQRIETMEEKSDERTDNMEQTD